jgi:ABC-2 type transport system permease protein
VSQRLELVAGPLRAMRRAALWWSIGIGSLVAVTLGFWPAFRGSSGISQAIDQLPSAVIQAFGLENFGTPAGFLRGNLYELFVPMLFAAAAVALANGQTASEEAAGRLEIYLAQPVDRPAVFAGRGVAAAIALTAIVLVVTLIQLGADALVDLRIDPGLLLSTVLLCSLLGALHGALALALAGLRPRPSMVLGVAIGVAIGGYLVAALFPLTSVLEPWRHVSPWDWALGGNPLESPTEPWRYAALGIPTIVLGVIGLAAFDRRDVAAG